MCLNIFSINVRSLETLLTHYISHSKSSCYNTKYYVLKCFFPVFIGCYMTLTAARIISTPSSRFRLEFRATAPLLCSPWLWARCGPLHSSVKQHSSFIPPLLMWDLSQNDLKEQDFITESKEGEKNPHTHTDRKTKSLFEFIIGLICV